MHNHAIKGIDLINNGSPIICDSFEHAKMTCKIILIECKAIPAKCFCDEIHIVLWEPLPINSLGGHHYYITFTIANALHTKDKALNTYKTFTAWEHVDKC